MSHHGKPNTINGGRFVTANMLFDMFDVGRLVFASGAAIFGWRVRFSQVHFQPARGWCLVFTFSFFTFVRRNDTNVKCSNAPRRGTFPWPFFSRVLTFS
jgi:hypothetical protein